MFSEGYLPPFLVTPEFRVMFCEDASEPNLGTPYVLCASALTEGRVTGGWRFFLLTLVNVINTLHHVRYN